MAIIKHIAIKSHDYGNTIKYLKYEHDEFTNQPLYDSSGHFIPRKDILITGINTTPDTFPLDCIELNKAYHKNLSRNDIKKHHYIISFSPEDIKYGLTIDLAQTIGINFANQFFPGHQTIVCTHSSGHNHTNNIHVHIVFNSLRCMNVSRDFFMERKSDCLAGYKHHVTKQYLRVLKSELMKICNEKCFKQVDLLSKSSKNISDREYRMKHRNAQKENTLFESRKDFLRSSIDSSLTISKDLEEFITILKEQYGIIVKESRGRFSYFHPDRPTPFTSRSLGTHYDKRYIEQILLEHRYPLEKGITHKTNHLTIDTFDELPKTLIDIYKNPKAVQNKYYKNKLLRINLKEISKTVLYLQEHNISSLTQLSEMKDDISLKLSFYQNKLSELNLNIKNTNKAIHFTGILYSTKSAYQLFHSSGYSTEVYKEKQTSIKDYYHAVNELSALFQNKPKPSLPELRNLKNKQNHEKELLSSTISNLQKEYDTLANISNNIVSLLSEDRTHHFDKSL